MIGEEDKTIQTRRLRGGESGTVVRRVEIPVGTHGHDCVGVQHGVRGEVMHLDVPHVHAVPHSLDVATLHHMTPLLADIYAGEALIIS